MDEATRPYAEGKLNGVYAFWHGRLLLMPMICPPGRKMHVLISTHRDGEMIARTMHHFGFGTVRGSSTRGGITAGMNAVKALQSGENVSITPDGPKGPIMQVQEGIITIAELAGLPIIPVTYASSRHKRMRTWDRFMVAMPFGTIYYKMGAPMLKPTKEALEREMVRITEDVDKCILSTAA